MGTVENLTTKTYEETIAYLQECIVPLTGAIYYDALWDNCTAHAIDTLAAEHEDVITELKIKDSHE